MSNQTMVMPMDQLRTSSRMSSESQSESRLSPSYWGSVVWTLLHKVTLLWVCGLGVLWSSAFLYAMFYYLYIPMISHATPVHFQFDSSCHGHLQPKGHCDVPHAEVALSTVKWPLTFARGQNYRFRLDLELPESEVNWNQGMFMVKIELLDAKRKVVLSSSRPAILQYKSPLLRTFCTIFYGPLMVVGLWKESQTTTVLLIEDFNEGSYDEVGPLTSARIEVLARDIHIWPSSRLVIQAHLQGLRYFMYYWPLSSALVGTFCIAMFLFVLVMLSIYRIASRPKPEENASTDTTSDFFTGDVDVEDEELEGIETNENSRNEQTDQNDFNDFNNALPDSSTDDFGELDDDN